eukprot:TRINITY_DN9288_c0_g1_i5.p1 TRINITY_DN9288_c0_g1~~TRINITY_DN9288_c0_g1_i5.p1  ORF type:complete len:483 (-),score=53.19 TRINITY_DN9288_c0_g1_i5:85-1533(-)
MEETNRKFVQILAAATPNLCQFTNGFSVSLSSYAVPQMLQATNGVQFTDEETSWFASIMALGSVTGALYGGYVADKIGRKKSLILDCLGLILSYVIIGVSNNFPIILFGRFLSGHFGGSNMVTSSIFVGEISHPSIRGFTGTLLIIEYCAGFTLSMLLGAIFPWKTVVYITIIFPTVAFFIMLALKESPSWLLRQKKESEAVDCLYFYRGNPVTVKEEIERMKDNLQRIEKQNETMGNTAMERLKNKLRRMTDSAFLKPFLLLNLMLNIGLDWGGFPALAFYMHTILEEVKAPVDPYWMAVILAAFRSVVCVGLSFILIKAPRRKMYLMSGSIVAVALFMQSAFAFLSPYLTDEIMVYARWIPLLAIFIQYLGFGLGWGAIMYMLQGEILPSDMRSFGCGLIGILDNIALFLAVKSIPILISNIGVGGMFSIYCVLVLITLTVGFFVMPETKGMSLEDIEDFYSAMRKKNVTTDEKSMSEKV